MKLNRLIRRDIMKYVSYQNFPLQLTKKKPTKLYKCNNFLQIHLAPLSLHN